MFLRYGHSLYRRRAADFLRLGPCHFALIDPAASAASCSVPDRLDCATRSDSALGGLYIGKPVTDVFRSQVSHEPGQWFSRMEGEVVPRCAAVISWPPLLY